jgi:hypothetical protein
MKRIKLIVQNEDTQARLVVAGFFILFAVLALLSS